MPSKKIILFIIFLIGLTSCQRASDPLALAASQLKKPSTNGAMVGQVISNQTGKPLADTVVRLAKVFWNEDHSEGAYVLEGATSPGDDTDEMGIFVFEDLKPAEYVIVVGDIMGDYEIISEPDGKAKIYTVEEGAVLQIDPLNVNLPKVANP